jgi:hypothetical protein
VRGPRQAPGDHLHAVVVEAEAVDRGRVLGQAEEARFRVAGLGARRGAADLEKAEARARQRCDRLGVLVEARGQAHGVGQVIPASVVFSRGEVTGPGEREHPGLKRRDGQRMGALGVHPAHDREAEAFPHGLEPLRKDMRAVLQRQGRVPQHIGVAQGP